jgi:hypothetical protein
MLMRRLLIGSCCLLLTGAEPEAVRWQTDYSKALASARASNKPLLVVFRCEH